MADPVIESPCISYCNIHPLTGYCLGCRRTRAEIRAWPTASDAERQAILDRLPARRAMPTRQAETGAE